MLTGKKCFVTGGAGAIGIAITKEFADQGALVVSADVEFCDDPSINRKNIEPNKSNIIKCYLDVTNANAVQASIHKYWEILEGIDALVNCAGILRSKKFDELSEDEWKQTIDINLTGTYNTSHFVYQKMKQHKGGVIINIASDAGEIGSTMSSADYAVSKAGVICLAKCIAREGARWNIRANSIAPGFIDTDLLKKFKDDWGEEMMNDIVSQYVPLKRKGLPVEVAKLAVFMASDNASYITGATYDINGGLCMN
ncbi:MAG: SDR family NAD(P)-dependent oxidoreductase [Synergistota bacterium]|nr:SDR family NAD(P)-dependent oxidoreductase [Synergistota bacterium]